MTESIKGKKLNKGEWAEFYVMLKLLGEGKLYTADKLLQKNYKSYLDILKVIRQECASQVLEYIIDEEKSTVTIKPQDSKEVFAVIPTSEFNENATTLFDNIKKARGNSVPAPDSVCDFASESTRRSGIEKTIWRQKRYIYRSKRRTNRHRVHIGLFD